MGAVLLLVLAAMLGVSNPQWFAFDSDETDGAPVIDRDSYSVAPRDILFNRFDGSSDLTPLSRLTDQQVYELRDKIRPIRDARYGPVDSAHGVGDGDLVIGYVDGDQAWAFPTRILNGHEIINENLAGKPVLISWCPLCHSAGVYDRRVDGRTLTFGNTSAVIYSNLVMFDFETASFWWQVAGRCVTGEYDGRELTLLSSTASTFAAWRMAHPNTLVLLATGGAAGAQPPLDWPTMMRRFNAGRFRYPVDRNVLDERLPNAVRVLLLGRGDRAVAYPIAGEKREFRDDFHGEPIVVTIEPSHITAHARRADGESNMLPSRIAFWYAAIAAEPRLDLRRN